MFNVVSVKHSGNLTLEEVITIARTMAERSMARSLAGTCKEILGKVTALVLDSNHNSFN